MCYRLQWSNRLRA